MNTVFKKLNYKQQAEIVILHAPSSFQKTINEMEPFTKVLTTIPPGKPIDFALVFATTQQQVNGAAIQLTPLLSPDAVLWFAYPKGTSKKYTCEFSRDTAWQVLGDLGFEGVRQIAIDEDWTALRFRQAKFIKTLKRNPQMAMSLEGKVRTDHTSQHAE
jgi:hypothetical protein